MIWVMLSLHCKCYIVWARAHRLGNAIFKLTLYGCVVSVCCVDFASLDVVCDELNDCAWNVCLLQLSD